MSGPAYLPLFGADYLSDTQHLSCEEHGAYLLLLIAAWGQDDCSLPDDDRKLARICRLSLRKWGFVRAAIEDFWMVKNGRLTNRRLAKERAYVDQKSNTNRQSARARWDKQTIETKQSTECERISERNAPQPQPHIEEEIPPKGGCASSDALTPAQIVLEWNDLADACGLAKVGKLTDARKRAVKVRLREYPELDAWQSAFSHIHASPFLRGENNRGWKADFDFLLQAKSFTKLVEGTYGQN